MEKLFEELRKAKEIDENEIKKIKYIKNKNSEKKIEHNFKKLVFEIKSKEEMYNEMKLRFRSQWKSPAFCNNEFSKPGVLQGNRLTEWQLFKAIQPDRNFLHPKGYRGFKTKYIGNEFGTAPDSIYPSLFKTHLQKTNEEYKNFLMRPTKYGKIKLDEQLDTLNLMNKEPFHLINTVQFKSFDFDKHKTWEAELLLRKKYKKK